MSDYPDQREAHAKELNNIYEKHEMKEVDISHYSKEELNDLLSKYLIDVMGMNEKQLNEEFKKRFPDLLGLPLDEKTVKRVGAKAQRVGVSLGKRKSK